MRRVAGVSAARPRAPLNLNALLKPSLADRAVGSAVRAVARPAFVEFNLLWIGCWVIVNLDLMPGVPPFDPFPFRLLMLVLPSEALFLVILVAADRRRLRRLCDRLEHLDALIGERSEGEGPVTWRAGRGACRRGPGSES